MSAKPSKKDALNVVRWTDDEEKWENCKEILNDLSWPQSIGCVKLIMVDDVHRLAIRIFFDARQNSGLLY